MTKTSVDKKKVFEEVGYEPHPSQKLFHDSKARFRIACCGRRFGKSVMAGHEMTTALFKPDSVYWICGPTYKLGEKEFRVVFDDFFRKFPFAQDRRFKKAYNLDQGNMRIETPWNSRLEVVSADKQDSLVGEGLDGVIMSEAALHKADTWQMYIQPALTDKRGWAIFPSTPRGHNWYEGMYMMGLDPQFSDWESWRFPTWNNTAVFLGEDDPELAAIKENASEFHWLQEYAAEFTALEGKIYDEFHKATHVTDIKYNPFWANYQGWDHGFADPTVCLDIMVDSMDNVYVWREYQVRRKTTTEHCLRLIARQDPTGYHVDGRFGGTADANENATVGTMLGPVISRVTPWIHGIEAVKRAMKIQKDGKPKFFIDRSCTETIRQLENLRTPDERVGRNAKEGQHDYDDHGPDALRYFFNEKFVWGYHAGSLDAVYAAQPGRTEAEAVLAYHTKLLNTSDMISYGPQI
jgi:hypothetical protein